jgi:diguanylate cyclase (GGDEF)-like protein
MLVTLQTLAEQMQLTERELEQRKSLVQFANDDVECLRAHREFISAHVDDIVRQFYQNQLSVPEISLLIGDADTMGRLRRAMRRYILELFDGYYDLHYVNKRLRIGKVHKQIGVSPKLFISGIWLLEKILNQNISEYAMHIGMPEIGDKLNNSLHKLLTLDTQFVFDTYISSLVAEVNTAKAQMEKQIEQLEVTISERTKELEMMSRRDGLTGLWNQNAFYEFLHHELVTAERYKENIALAYLDIDGFKALNDTQGHVVGDQNLIQLGNVLKEGVRECDIPCRVGGDEFAVIFPKTTLSEARATCERVIERVKKANLLAVTVSIGITAAGKEYYPPVHDFIREADRNMYNSKSLSTTDKDFHIN